MSHRTVLRCTVVCAFNIKYYVHILQLCHTKLHQPNLITNEVTDCPIIGTVLKTVFARRDVEEYRRLQAAVPARVEDFNPKNNELKSSARVWNNEVDILVRYVTKQ